MPVQRRNQQPIQGTSTVTRGWVYLPRYRTKVLIVILGRSLVVSLALFGFKFCLLVKIWWSFGCSCKVIGVPQIGLLCLPRTGTSSYQAKDARKSRRWRMKRNLLEGTGMHPIVEQNLTNYLP
jgi:hypothetical protein